MNDEFLLRIHVDEALSILKDLGMPRAQQNDRTALCLLALLNLTPDKEWDKATAPLMGITPIITWVKDHYGKNYAPNTRETFRRQSMHQFLDSGLVLYNPDGPTRPVNSPKAVYQIEETALDLLRSFGTKSWEGKLNTYLREKGTLAERYAMDRQQNMVPVQIQGGQRVSLSPGEHSELIKKIIEDFIPRFAPGGFLVYVGDTGDKWGYFDQSLLSEVNVEIDPHGKMPDVIIFYREKNWLILAESVTSHGPVDGKRREELGKLFDGATAGLVYVTAFPDRSTMGKFSGEIAWETEVWVAEDPSHLIHFNGDRFLGPR